MRNKFSILIAFIVLALTSNAQVSLKTFQIGQNYLQNNALKVQNTSVATPFKFLVSTTRSVKSTGGYVDGNCTVTLYYTKNLSGDSNIPNDPSTVSLVTRNISYRHYNNSNQATLYDIDASLPANKSDGYLVLKLEYLDNQNVTRTSYSSTRYGIYVVPPITNNVISLQEDGLNWPSIAGSTPQGGPSNSYFYDWEYKNENGNFVLDEYYGYYKQNGQLVRFPANGYLNYNDPQPGVTYRRVVKSSDKISYSNEFTFKKIPKTNFTVSKEPVLNNKGELIGNTMKIILEHPSPEARFKLVVWGYNGDFYIPLNKDYEFYMPRYSDPNDTDNYNDVVLIYSNFDDNRGAAIYPTWENRPDKY